MVEASIGDCSTWDTPNLSVSRGILMQDQEMVASINLEPSRKGEGYKFRGIVNFAFERERGNTDQDQIDRDGNMPLRSKTDRYNLLSRYEKDIKNTTREKWKLESSYNHFLAKQW